MSLFYSRMGFSKNTAFKMLNTVYRRTQAKNRRLSSDVHTNPHYPEVYAASAMKQELFNARDLRLTRPGMLVPCHGAVVQILSLLEILYDLTPRIWNSGAGGHNADVMSTAPARGTMVAERRATVLGFTPYRSNLPGHIPCSISPPRESSRSVNLSSD